MTPQRAALNGADVAQRGVHHEAVARADPQRAKVLAEVKPR